MALLPKEVISALVEMPGMNTALVTQLQATQAAITANTAAVNRLAEALENAPTVTFSTMVS